MCLVGCDAALPLNEDVFVKLGIVVIFKTHNASFKWVHNGFLILKLFLRDLNTLLHKICCHCRRFPALLFVSYNHLKAFGLQVHINLSFNVGVSWAVTYFMAFLLATLASSRLLRFSFTQCQIISFRIQSDVPGELTAQGSLKLLSTAPPNLPRPLADMRTTRPVEIIFVEEIFAAHFANQSTLFHISFPLPELDDSQVHHYDIFFKPFKQVFLLFNCKPFFTKRVVLLTGLLLKVDDLLLLFLLFHSTIHE